MIHQQGIRRPAFVWVSFLLLLLAMAFTLITRFKVESDLWAFLPTSGDSPEKRLTRNLLSGRLSQALVLAIVPGSEQCVERRDCSPLTQDKALRIGSILADELAEQAGVQSANSGPTPGFEDAVQKLYFESRFALARPGPGQPYSQENINAKVKGLRAFLASPKAALYRSQLVADPLLYFPEQIERLAALKPTGVEMKNGQFVTPAGISLVFVDLAPRLSGDDKARVFSFLMRRFNELNAGGPACRLMTSGALPFEVQGEAKSKADMQRVGIISAAMAILLSLLLFRSALSLLAVLLPVVLGFGAGCATTLLLFGNVHVLTLAFGASLIGVSLDYPLHLLNEGALSQISLREAASRTRPGLLIGCLTTVVGFFAFGLTSATALLQVAVFAVSGLVAALCSTLFLLPLIPLRLGSGSIQRLLMAQLERVLPAMQRHAWLNVSAVTLGLMLSGYFVFTHLGPTNPDLLDPSPPTLKAEDAFVRSQLGVSEDMLVSTSANLQSAIETAYQLSQDLDAEHAIGQVQGYRSLAALYLPSRIQEHNRAKAASSQTAKFFEKALREADFEPAAFAESPLGKSAAAELPLLDYDQLKNSQLGHLVDPFVFENDEGASVVTQVSASTEALTRVLAAHPEVILYQPKQFLTLSFSALARSIRTALLVALSLMLIIVYARNRSLRSTLAAFLPAAAGGLGALAIVGQIEALHVFHLLAAIVVLSMGIDYGTFMVETHRRDSRPDAWPSVVAAAASTLISFGGLGLSTVPALRAIGLVIGIGIFIALLTTPFCYSVLAEKRGAS